VGPRAGLDRCGKSRPHRDSIPDRTTRSQSVYRRLSYPAHSGRTKEEKKITDSREPSLDLKARTSEHEVEKLKVVLTKRA
jgi:hypothetical protein